MSSCCILLSTYNGELFLKDQIESLYNQDFQGDIILYIRDDGSSDGTMEILNALVPCNAIKEIIINKGSNIGVQKSFLELMRTAPDADYYAFCDQDDYWKPNKISVAVEKIKQIEDRPVLFFSSYDVVNQDLQFINKEIINKNACHSITKIIFHNKIPGCTMVFNRELNRKCNMLSIDNIRMHDMFVVSIGYLLGEIIGVDESLILYRQHNNNVLGYKRKITRKKSVIKRYYADELATKILEKYSDIINADSKKELKTISEYKTSFVAWIKLLLSCETVSQNRWRSTLSIKKMILFKRA